MSPTEISLTNADEASYLAATRPVARLVSFPDGIERLIIARACYWEAWDHQVNVLGWDGNALPMLAYKSALAFHSEDGAAGFEDGLRWFFNTMLELTVAEKLTAEKPVANGGR